MKRLRSSGTALLIFLAVSAGQSVTRAAEGDEVAMLETRAYALGGYIPKFYEIPLDPFDENEANAQKEKLTEHKKAIVSYLKQHGIEARKIEFDPHSNAVSLTDTPENLAMHEVMLRYLFTPDMQLRAIDGATRALADTRILEGDQLSRIGFLDEITFRAFHGEVRKLENELEKLPEDHQERKIIVERLRIAKEYRKEAIKLYLKSLNEQKVLIARWQETTRKTKQDGPDQPAAAPQLKTEGLDKPRPESEGPVPSLDDHLR